MRETKGLDLLGCGAINVDEIIETKDTQLVLKLEKVGLPIGAEAVCPNQVADDIARLLRENSGHITKAGGGSAANVVHAFARLGGQAAILGAVGNDPNGDFAIDTLPPADGARVIRLQGNTGRAVSLVFRGERTLALFPGVNDALVPSMIDLHALRGCRCVHLTPFVCSLGDGPLRAQEILVANLPDEAVLSLDPGRLYADRGMTAIGALLKRTTIVFATDVELLRLAGTASLTEAAEAVLSKGPIIIICKLGALGVKIMMHSGTRYIPAPSVEPRDTTGAGDVLAATFLAAYLARRSTDAAAEFAARVASTSVTAPGRLRYPTETDFARFLSACPSAN
jgi:ribokinase